ncbi:MAG: ankyrin repeat-containing domain protein [Benjaminiella poitrasii]|nr:MAG: ankyrin repeat-containing domain protein [Benjaminiella poitrasii]
MMYAAQLKPLASFNNDSCFEDVDLTESIKLQNHKGIEMLHHHHHQVITMEPKPNITIWKAAELGNMAALTYFIQHHASLFQSKEDEDNDEEKDDENNSITRLLNSRDPTTECTLIYLIVANNPNPIEPLRLLLEQGADATARNMYNVQAIHAIFPECPEPLEVLKLLLKHGADPNAQDGDGWTPAHYAARFCKSPGPILKLLIESGADINAVDASNRTAAFGLLANGDHSDALDWLIHTAKANLKVRGDFLDGQTRCTKRGSLILQAAKHGRLACLRILISSSSAMESLESILTKNELMLAVDFVRHLLVKVTKKDATERLGLMIMILKDLIQKMYPERREFASLEDVERNSHGLYELSPHRLVKRKPSLLKRMGNSLWRPK